MIIEKLDNRFGTTAVGKGFITSHQLVEALEIQARENVAGKKRRLIGEILVGLGFVTLPQIEEILASMA
jgi:hypothetical protein